MELQGQNEMLFLQHSRLIGGYCNNIQVDYLLVSNTAIGA